MSMASFSAAAIRLGWRISIGLRQDVINGQTSNRPRRFCRRSTDLRHAPRKVEAFEADLREALCRARLIREGYLHLLPRTDDPIARRQCSAHSKAKTNRSDFDVPSIESLRSLAAFGCSVMPGSKLTHGEDMREHCEPCGLLVVRNQASSMVSSARALHTAAFSFCRAWRSWSKSMGLMRCGEPASRVRRRSASCRSRTIA